MQPRQQQQQHELQQDKELPCKPIAARFQEIFVDLIGMHCSFTEAATRHVLDGRFESFLAEGERSFLRAHC